MAQKCILESYLKRPEALFFLNLTPPTLLFVDIHALADRGANNLRKLQIRHPKLLIVMLAEKSVPEQIVSALRAGASGYLISPVSPLQLNHCIRAADRSWPFFCQQTQDSLVDWLLNHNQGSRVQFLSARERQMVPFLFGSLSDRQIGRLLGLSIHELDQILSQLFKKLMAQTRSQAVRNLMDFIPLQGRRVRFITSLALPT